MNTPEHTRQRVIGLLGGISWESTAEYYRLANELVRDRLAGLHSARLSSPPSTSPTIEATAGRPARGTRPAAAGRGRPPARGRRGGPARVVHQHHAQGGRPGRRRPSRFRCCTSATPPPPPCAAGSHHGRSARARPSRWSRTSTATGWPRHGLERARPRRRRPGRGAPGHLRRAVPRRRARRVAAAYRPSSTASSRRAPQGVILGCTEIELLIGPADSPRPGVPDHPAARRGRRGAPARPASRAASTP